MGERENQQGALPSNAMIAAKALSLAPNFDIDLDSFKAGESWLVRFKSRCQISYKKAYGEKQSADAELDDIFLKETLPQLLAILLATSIINSKKQSIITNFFK